LGFTTRMAARNTPLEVARKAARNGAARSARSQKLRSQSPINNQESAIPNPQSANRQLPIVNRQCCRP
jgi:hypothetical protein